MTTDDARHILVVANETAVSNALVELLEKQAAESLVSAGACVLGQNVDSPATGQYAESQGIPWVV